MPRETLRRREQKAALFSVISGTARRRPLEPEEAKALFHAIDTKQSAGFGIRKLSTLELDDLHEAPACIHWEKRITLLYYAAWRNRHHFVNSLLRAGADPAARDVGIDGLCTTSPNGAARERLAGVRPELAAWAARALVVLRFAGSKMQPSAACEDCGRPAPCLPLVWEPCGHACCEECFWVRVCKCTARDSIDFSCPNCSAPVQDRSSSSPEMVQSKAVVNVDGKVNGDWECGSCSYLNFARRMDCRNCGGQRFQPNSDGEDIAACNDSEPQANSAVVDAAVETSPSDTLEPIDRRVASLRRWDALPVERESAPHRREKFQALDPARAVATRLGNTRSERTSELHKAAAGGETRRLSALITAGVDLEASNEYGQTALFLAAWFGHAESVRLLLETRVDINTTAHGGSTPVIAVAASAEHTTVLQLLIEASADLDKAGSECKTAREYISSPSTKVLSEIRISPKLTVLIPSGCDHPGAGSFYIDDAFSEKFLCRLESLFVSLPVAERMKTCTSDRSYFCDSEGWIQREFSDGVLYAGALNGNCLVTARSYVQMRFLHYIEVGGGLAPHVDLSRTDPSGCRSTHTFLLYLSDCGEGGETVLLEHQNDESPVLASVTPRRGRLFLFPHLCPHLARPTVAVPKLLLRGEMLCA